MECHLDSHKCGSTAVGVASNSQLTILIESPCITLSICYISLLMGAEILDISYWNAALNNLARLIRDPRSDLRSDPDPLAMLRFKGDDGLTLTGVVLGDPAIASEFLDLLTRFEAFQHCTESEKVKNAAICRNPTQNCIYFVQSKSHFRFKDELAVDFFVLCYSILDYNSFAQLFEWNNLLEEKWKHYFKFIGNRALEFMPPKIVVGIHAHFKVKIMQDKKIINHYCHFR